MQLQLEGRVAIVTGGARGIGAATAIRLAEAGADVVMCDINLDSAQEPANAIEALGRRSKVVKCDVANRAEVEEMVSDVIDTFGRLDILVNNAGVTRDNLLFKMSDEDWDLVMDVHLKGMFLCTRAVQKHMVEQRFGKIVSISSGSAAGNRGQANYATAKAGIQGFTRTVAIELGQFNINVNAVSPGFVDSDMTRATARRLGQDPEEFIEARAATIPMRRAGQPRDIANAICFLCTEDANFITGQIINVRGGPGPLG